MPGTVLGGDTATSKRDGPCPSGTNVALGQADDKGEDRGARGHTSAGKQSPAGQGPQSGVGGVGLDRPWQTWLTVAVFIKFYWNPALLFPFVVCGCLRREQLPGWLGRSHLLSGP